MKHKHAEFFTAIANGESLDDWECAYFGREYPYAHRREWGEINFYVSDIAKDPQNWVVRRKQVTHEVNGFTVPAPLRFAPAKGAVYFVSCTSAIALAYKGYWGEKDDSRDKIHLLRGLVHLTKEAAVANAKAMCGIDPESDDE